MEWEVKNPSGLANWKSKNNINSFVRFNVPVLVDRSEKESFLQEAVFIVSFERKTKNSAPGFP